MAKCLLLLVLRLKPCPSVGRPLLPMVGLLLTLREARYLEAIKHLLTEVTDFSQPPLTPDPTQIVQRITLTSREDSNTTTVVTNPATILLFHLCPPSNALQTTTDETLLTESRNPFPSPQHHQRTIGRNISCHLKTDLRLQLMVIGRRNDEESLPRRISNASGRS